MSTQTEQPMVSVEAICESPLGADLSESQCLMLAEASSIIGLDVGAPLLDEGHVDDSLYVVSSGSLEVFKPTGGGDTITLQLLHSGDMAGILGFVDGVPHSAAIRALTQCELIVLNRKDLEKLIEEDPQLVYQVMRAVVRAAHRILGKMNAQFVEMSNYISQQHGRY